MMSFVKNLRRFPIVAGAIGLPLIRSSSQLQEQLNIIDALSRDPSTSPNPYASRAIQRNLGSYQTLDSIRKVCYKFVFFEWVRLDTRLSPIGRLPPNPSGTIRRFPRNGDAGVGAMGSSAKPKTFARRCRLSMVS